MRVARPFTLILIALGTACGGSGPQAVKPSPTPEAAVRGFFQAVADSDLVRMSMLWGTDKGSAASTGQPPDWKKRMTVAQIYLRGAPMRILGDQPLEGTTDQRKLEVELDRGECKRVVPVLTVHSQRDGWLVNAIDLNLAGSPARPCAQPEEAH
jgi:hypothetical protein